MAEKEKKIVRGVRLGSKVYTAGMEGELAEVLKPEDAERLAAKGHIEGQWGKSQPKADDKAKK